MSLFSLVSLLLLVSSLKSAPNWLSAVSETLIPPVRDALIGKLTEKALDKGIQAVQPTVPNKKEQTRHLELALKNAAERGLARLHTTEERERYNKILAFLSESGSHSKELRYEILRLFTLFGMPNLDELQEAYNRSLRTRPLSRTEVPKDTDAALYLGIFFDALISELYIDPIFHKHISDSLMVRTSLNVQRSLTEIVTTLNQIGTAVTKDYNVEQLEREIDVYTTHIEGALRYLKLVGIVLKDRDHANKDPELEAIFVPLRISLQEYTEFKAESENSIISLIESSSCLVILGGPGSGKSTLTRYLAWSHAIANLSSSDTSLLNIPLLSGKPLPLRIELRRLSEDRKQRPDYNFLSYSVEVLLGRAGIHIHRQMFEELLERRAMLLLFDGLDEVTALDERRRLVEEIENLAQRYPGNRFLITSRPVGYELVRFSDNLFSHAQIQEFDEAQIRMFLERWYAYVLRLSPLPPDDRQELETLYTTLIDNPRLHNLAMNPLLLAVIASIHRYERLPDKRVLVYDRCADLLLDTWIRLKGKGIDANLKDTFLTKEDQYACIAHLGFVLHEYPQERGKSNKDTVAGKSRTTTRELVNVDVGTARFMFREIVRFFEKQQLFQSIAQRHAEAERFLKYMSVEAGLVVERGTDESGEPLYSFVHSTFQEYFAAADVYERYQQEEDPTIISEFLRKHLHDPHWHEVILLLFGKLRRKPATAQLRQILEGTIRSHVSQSIDFIHQDLFFVSACLAEDIAVENELAASIITRLGDVVKNYPSQPQGYDALESLASLMQTQQYANLAQEKLTAIVTQDIKPDLDVKIQAARTLYKYSSLGSLERQQVHQMLLDLMQMPELPFEQAVQICQALYEYSALWSEKEQQYAIKMLLALAHRDDLSIKQISEIAGNLYRIGPNKSVKLQQIPQMLLGLANQSDRTVKKTLRSAQTLYQRNFNMPEKDA